MAMAGKFPRLRCRAKCHAPDALSAYHSASSCHCVAVEFEIFEKSPGLINCVRWTRATQNFIHDVAVRRRLSEIEAKRYVVCNVDLLIARFHEQVVECECLV